MTDQDSVDETFMHKLPQLLAAVTVAISLAPSAGFSEDWPQHLGPRRDGTSAEPAPAAWEKVGPKVVWRNRVGHGYAAPSVAGNRVFVFHRVDNDVLLDCLKVDDGSLVWSYRSPTSYRDNFGFSDGPRAAPTVTDDHVVIFGADGILTAVDRADGKEIWQIDTHKKFGVKQGFFGAAASPLVENGRIYLNIGGDTGSLVAFDLADGKVLWTSGTATASYSSAVSATFKGLPAIVFFTRDGVDVAGPEQGTILAAFPWRARNSSSVNAATPLLFGNRIFVSSSYGAGAVLLDGSSGKLAPVWSSDDAMTNHYATSVRYGELLFGFHGRQEYGAALRAVEIETGTVRWNVDGFGAGSLIRVGNRLLILHEDGRLILIAASGQQLEVLAESPILKPTVRSLPAYANGVVFAHNERELVAVRVR